VPRHETTSTEPMSSCRLPRSGAELESGTSGVGVDAVAIGGGTGSGRALSITPAMTVPITRKAITSWR
jgi:hypothetical protein